MRELKYIELKDLKPYKNNPRKNEDGVEKVRESIELFGFNVPLIVTDKLEIVAGHTRYKAAEELGLDKVPCIVIDDLSKDKIKQYRIIDNKTGELANWDYEKLFRELDDIQEINLDPFFAFQMPEEKEMRDQIIADNEEISLDEFSDDNFEIECPECGFRWNV